MNQLNKEELHKLSILEEKWKEQIKYCRQGIGLSQEINSLKEETVSILKEVIPLRNVPLRRQLNQLEKEPFTIWSDARSGYVLEGETVKLEKWLNFVKEVREKIEMDLPEGLKEEIRTENEKINERALLLLRLYWKDKLYDIGKKLGITYFTQFERYWDIDEYKGALEISKKISDNDLLELVKKNPLQKYRFTYLGGFQGQYYTFTESGEIKLSSSWESVRKNVEKALKKWGDRAWALFQALIDKEGRATYFEIIDGMEKYGQSYAPSFLLPRLQSLKLVFKTGSRKYPDWTIPPEIIPLLKELLKKREIIVKEFGKGTEEIKVERKISKEEAINFQILRAEKEAEKICDQIVETRRVINILFESKFHTKLFRDYEKAILDIRKLCTNEDEFNNKIQALTILINEIETEKIKELIINKDNLASGSINILERFLEEKIPGYNKEIVTIFRNIVTLRSKKYPTHPDQPEFIKAQKYFGIDSYPPNWGELWQKVLRKYLEALNKLKVNINNFNKI